jgi:hypothetical protein
MIPLLMMTSRNTEVGGILPQMINGYDATTLNTDPTLEVFFNELKPLSEQFISAIRRMKVRSEAKHYDDIRDQKLMAVYFLLQSFSHHPTERIRSAALFLLTIFENYGIEIKDESLTRQSSLLNSLLADLASPEAQENINIVPQCATYITALQTAQSNFENNRLDFEEAQAEEGTQENASVMKKQVLEIVNKKIVAYLNVMIQVDDAMYGPYARTLAEIISANNEVVKKRRNKNDKPEEGED